jgi:DNA-binding NarL/FixJ family response regulator
MADASEALRVVLIDDHEMVAEALELALRAAGVDVLGRASSLADGVALAAASSPDVVLLDFRLPDGDGIDGVRSLAEVAPAAAVLVVTAVADDRTAVDVLAAGATGYVTKDLQVIDLVDALQRASRGETVVAPALMNAVMGRLRSVSAGAHVTLTARERETLSLLARGSGIDEVATAMTVSRNTARKHVQAVLVKLGAHSQLEAVAIARRHGLLDGEG